MERIAERITIEDLTLPESSPPAPQNSPKQEPVRVRRLGDKIFSLLTHLIYGDHKRDYRSYRAVFGVACHSGTP